MIHVSSFNYKMLKALISTVFIYLFYFQVYYQTCKEIEAGQELLVCNTKTDLSEDSAGQERKDLLAGKVRS